MTPSIIDESIWRGLAWAMLHFFWIGAGAGLLMALVERCFLRRATPNLRYAGGLCGLVFMTLIAAACVWHQIPRGDTFSAGVELSEPVQISAQTNRSEEIGSTTVAVTGEDLVGSDSAAVISDSRAGATAVDAREWLAVLPWIWIIGSTGLAVFLSFGLIGTWRLRIGSSDVGDTGVGRCCDELCARLGIGIRVGVATSGRVGSPLLLGVFRPLIVLPASTVSGLSPAMVEWILLHELGHVRRLDNAVILVQRALECVLFFQPCVWMLSRWIDREREFCCDEFALAQNGDEDPADYAATLAKMAGLGSLPAVPVAAMANQAVVHRIRRVLNEQRAEARSGGAFFGALFLGVMLLAVTMSLPTGANAKPEPTMISARFLTPPNGPPRGAYNFNGRGQPIQQWLETRGFSFPDGAYVVHDPRQSVLAVRHDPTTVNRIAKEIEGLIPQQKAQVILHQKLVWTGRGGDVETLTLSSVVASSGQELRVETIRELILTRDQAIKFGLIEGGDTAEKFEVVNLGVQTDVKIETSDWKNIHLEGGAVIRVPSGSGVIDSLKSIQRTKPDPNKIKGIDVHRAPFDRMVASANTIEVEFSPLKERRFVKRVRRSPGTLKLVLTADVIDPSGRAVSGAPGPFRLGKVPALASDAGRSRQLTMVAMLAHDLRKFEMAEENARAALTFDPDSAERLAFWNLAVKALQSGSEELIEAWDERSYRLREPIMPGECVKGGGALRAFLSDLGMGFPEGATARVEADGVTVVVKNEVAEIRKLEAGLYERLLVFSEGAVSITAETFRGAGEFFETTLGSPPDWSDGVKGVVGVFSEAEYELLVGRAIDEGAERVTVAAGRVVPGEKLDAFADLELSGWLGEIRAEVGRGYSTIGVNFAIKKVVDGEQVEGAFETRALSTSLTVRDAQWVALAIPDVGELTKYVFVRLEIEYL